MKLTERIHPPCSCKDCLEVEEKARKWDEFQQTFIISEPRTRFTNILQNQKLREVIEKRIREIESLEDKDNLYAGHDKIIKINLHITTRGE